MLKNMNKTTTIETLKGFPEEFDLQEFVDKLIFIDKIKEGLKASEEGRTIPLSDIEEGFEEKWSK
jgi:predicted transcriptional regulator